MPSPFVSSSVAYPLSAGEFDHISPGDRKKILRLIARISEKSFRRGFQHGRELDPANDRRSPYDFRFKQGLDNATGPDGRAKMSAMERLDVECGDVLREVGLNR